jgi:hypothetical protein
MEDIGQMEQKYKEPIEDKKKNIKKLSEKF